jgi:HSP20 family protein
MTLIRKTNSFFPAFSSMFDDLMNHERLLKNADIMQSPAANIKETEDGFVIELAAPGKQKDDFKIELNHNVLSISSESKTEHEVKDEKERYTRKEFNYNSFQRSFVLPSSVDSDKITANYENGVLNISIPKKEEVKKKPVRNIEIA